MAVIPAPYYNHRALIMFLIKAKVITSPTFAHAMDIVVERMDREFLEGLMIGG